MTPSLQQSALPILPIVRLARILGILPYSHIQGTDLRIRLKHSRYLYGTFLGVVSLLSVSVIVSLCQDASRLSESTQTTNLSSEIIEFILNCSSVILMIAVAAFVRSSCQFFTKFMRYLIKVDAALSSTPGNPQRGLIQVVTGSIIWTSRAALTTWLFGLPFRDVLLIPMWYLVLATEQLTVVLCSEIALRYGAINSTLNEMRTSSATKQQSTTNRVHSDLTMEELRADKLLDTKLAWLETSHHDYPLAVSPTRIEALREAHSSLADAFQELNNRAGIFLLLDLAYLFALLLNTTITFLQHCVIQQGRDDRGEASACVGYSILAFDGLLRMSVISISCGAVGEEAERTAEAAARLLRRAIDWEALRELQILGAQVRARRVAFWACGLFTVDRPLLFSICGAVTSYLFILSQLK